MLEYAVSFEEERIMNIEEIMKPYFDKKEEFEKRYIEERNFIKIRLERLRDKKEQEIAEYLQNEVLSKSNFVGYEAVRKDLEQAYLKKEKELELELQNYNKSYKDDAAKLNQIKYDLRKQLISAKKEIELELEENQINLNITMLKLSKFKHLYNNDNIAINGEELKKIFEERDYIIEKSNLLRKNLEKIAEYLNIEDLPLKETEENVVVENVEDLEQETEELDQDLPEEENKGEDDLEQTGEIIEPEKEDENVHEFNNVVELLQTVYTDILQLMKDEGKLTTINLKSENGDAYLTTKDSNGKEQELDGEIDFGSYEERIEMPNGVYLNQKDIFNALKKYKKQNKGRTFKVKGFDDSMEINRKSIKALKKSLRDCSIIKLLREKKLGNFDIQRVYGKQKSEKYSKYVELGKVKTNAPSGKYVNVQELGSNLSLLFAKKSPSWLEKLTYRASETFLGESYFIDEEKQKTI